MIAEAGKSKLLITTMANLITGLMSKLIQYSPKILELTSCPEGHPEVPILGKADSTIKLMAALINNVAKTP